MNNQSRHFRDLVFVGCGYLSKCPRDWGRLNEGSLEKERHCATCNKTVYRCDSEKEFQEHARAEHCVAFSGSIFPERKLQNDKNYFGGPIVDYQVGGALEWD